MNQGPDSMQKRVGNGPWKCIGCGIPITPSCFNLFFELDTSAPTAVPRRMPGPVEDRFAGL